MKDIKIPLNIVKMGGKLLILIPKNLTHLFDRGDKVELNLNTNEIERV